MRAKDGSFSLSIDTKTGAVTAYWDLDLDARARSLPEPIGEPRIQEMDAAQVASTFLEACIGPTVEFRLESIEEKPAPPGYDVPLYEVRFRQPATEPWQGAVNRFKVTVDGQEGRVLLAGGTVRLRFSAPRSVLDAQGAVSAIRSVFEAERSACRSRGDAGGEQTWAWPGDGEAMRVLRLESFSDGEATSSSTAGKAIRDAGLVRMAYHVATGGVAVAVDAETGEALAAARVKHAAQAQDGAPAGRAEPARPGRPTAIPWAGMFAAGAASLLGLGWLLRSLVRRG